MRWLRTVALLVLLPVAAAAQPGPGPNNGAFPGPVNVLSATGYKINNLNALSSSGASVIPDWLSGPYAGASQTAGGQLSDVFGYGAFVSNTNQASETTVVGHNGAMFSTTGGALAVLGTGGCGGITTQNGDICINSDALRDYGGAGTDIGIGAGALSDGNGAFPNFAIGADAQWGSQSTITVGTGTPTAGDTYPFTVSSSNTCNGSTITINCTTGTPVTVTYTVQAGDTTAAILASSLSAYLQTNLNGIGYTMGNGIPLSAISVVGVGFPIHDPTNYPTVLIGHYPWAFKLSISAGACTGTCTNTMTVGPGYTGGSNLTIGNYLMNGVLATNPSYNVIASFGGPANFVTTMSFVSLFGDAQGPKMAGATFDEGLGYHNYTTCVNCSQNVAAGSYIDFTGNNNSVFGDHATSSITISGNNNDVYGSAAALPSNSGSNQGVWKNLLYLAGASGTGSTYGVGTVGVGIQVPVARFDILGTDTSGSTLAFRVQNSTPANVLSVSDSGVVTLGAGAFTANATTALSLTALGPSGAHALVQEWLTVTDSGGTVRYIPAF